MGETGHQLVRFAGGSLDPRAQEFRPRTNPNNFPPPQIPLLGPPPPPLPHQVFFSYSPLPPEVLPYSIDGNILGYHHQYPSPPACVRTIPPLPPESAVPTRTFVLSSVPCDVSETLIRRELEVFGEVRGVEMERVRDGIVTVHFYDLRHAELALKEIRSQHMQQQERLRNFFAALSHNSAGEAATASSLLTLTPPLPLLPPHPPPAPGLVAGCAVWAQFTIPSCTAVPEGHNQGTIVVFNLDPNVSTSSLREIFQAFGPVKELRETPLKRQQRFVEFYDVRDASKALREMCGKEIHGKQVVIEFSRPGGGYGRKFHNATAITNSPKAYSSAVLQCTANNSIHQVKISKYGSTLSPPLSRRFMASSGGKKGSDSSKGNPNNENLNDKVGYIEGPMGCLSLSGGEAKGGSPPRKRNPKSKSQSSNQTTKQQLSKSSSSSSRGAWKGKQAKKLDTRFLINEESMVESSCTDSRTTVMIKNIPNKYSQKLLLNMLDNHCIHCNEQITDGDDQPLSSYDFVYLPIDFNNKCNVGYGFVNMTSPQATWRLYKAFHHQHWEVFNSRKICEVTYARVQGLEALKEHFKNSKFPCEMDHYLPVVFSPPRDGGQQTDPLPIVGHKQRQQMLQPIISGLLPYASTSSDDHHESDGGGDLNNNSNDDDDEEEEGNLNCTPSSRSCCSQSRNGGDDDKDSSSCSSSGQQ